MRGYGARFSEEPGREGLRPKAPASCAQTLCPHPADVNQIPERLNNSNYVLKQLEGFAELLAAIFRKGFDGFGEGFDPPLAAFPHEADSFGGRFEAHATAVFRFVAANEAGALQAGHNAAHRGWTDLLGIGQFAERSGPTKHEDREGGKLRRPDATFLVADAQAAQQVNGCGVQLVGHFQRRSRCGQTIGRRGCRRKGRRCGGPGRCRSKRSGAERFGCGRSRGVCGRCGRSSGSGPRGGRDFRSGAFFMLDRAHER